MYACKLIFREACKGPMDLILAGPYSLGSIRPGSFTSLSTREPFEGDAQDGT